MLDEVSRYLDDHAGAVSAMVATYGAKGLDVSQPFTAVPAEWKAAIDAAKEMPSRGSIRQSEERRLVESIQSIQRYAENTRTLQDARDQLDEVIGSVRVAAQTMQVDGAQTLRAVQTLASVLSTVPGPKSLIYIGDGVPMRPGEELLNLLADVFEGDRRFQEQGGSPPPRPVPRGPPRRASRGRGCAPSSGPTGAPGRDRADGRIDQQAANREPGDGPHAGAARAHRHCQQSSRDHLRLVERRPQQPDRRRTNYGTRTPPAAVIAYEVSRSQLREQALQFMADDTGGLALGAEVAVPQFLDRVLADPERRYSLAYVSPHGGDARYHKIKVKVARKGLALRAREGYIDRPRQVRVGDLVAGALLWARATIRTSSSSPSRRRCRPRTTRWRSPSACRSRSISSTSRPPATSTRPSSISTCCRATRAARWRRCARSRSRSWSPKRRWRRRTASTTPICLP